MKLAKISGSINFDSFFIYSAANSEYYELFGKSFINSILRNTSYKVHIHLFNPSPKLEILRDQRVSYSYEIFSENYLIDLKKKYTKTQPINERKKHILRMLYVKNIKKYDQIELIIGEQISKAYYACVRFIRLYELIKNQSVLCLDIDCIVRKDFKINVEREEIHIYGSPELNDFKAGTILITEHGHSFLKQFSNLLEQNILNDYLYWFLDQDILSFIVQNYNYKLLNKSFIDWEFNEDSIIWQAKGMRKDDDIFVNTQRNYVI